VAEIPYVYREDLESALDVKPSAYMGAELDRACRSASRMVDNLCHRTFYPWTGTRTFDYPGDRSTSMEVWLDDQELIEAASVISGGTSIPADDGYLLRPDFGPPFSRLEISRAGAYGFSAGSTSQRSIGITGLWGYRNDETAASTLAASVASAAAFAITVTTPLAGIGSLLRIDSERLLVTGKGFTASGQVSPSLAANNAGNTLAVSDGSVFTPGEVLLIDGERVQVQDIAGNLLVVRRAVQGSTLAAHTAGAAIYWQHVFAVERGAAGTTAAAHSSGAAIVRWEPPSEVRELAQAYAEDTFLQRNSGYARTSGQGENERPTSGRGIVQLESRIRASLVRSARTRAV
jgi:hypothetical protein